MRAYKYLAALVIILLVNKSLARSGIMWTSSNVTNTFVILEPERVAALENTHNKNDNNCSNFERGSKIIPIEHHLDDCPKCADCPKPADCPKCVDCPTCRECPICADCPKTLAPPLRSGEVILGEKRYYFETVVKVNWYKALQKCRSYGMHLASITSQEENDRLVDHIKHLNVGHELFWTSGTDQAEEGSFFWMANGKSITFHNWFEDEPNNGGSENAAGENCVVLMSRVEKGFKWNDIVCSAGTFFICEVQ